MREKGTRPTRVTKAATARRPAAPSGAARLLGLQRAAGNAAVAAMLAPGPVAVQRVAAQIGMALDGVTIADLTVRGRPESPFTGTMGDHTTAFVVQAESVRNAVVGQTPEQAVRGILELVDRAGKLPGAGRAANLGAGHAAKLHAARETVEELGDRIAGLRPDDPRLMTTLQSLVAAYLHYRELIPLSTLNIKSVSAGLAGRGKGESSARRGMAGYERADPDTLKTAIKGLLDFEGLAVLATQFTASAVAVIAPGADPDNPIHPILAQHLSSISAAYPGAVMRAWGDVAAAFADLRAALDPYVDVQKAHNVKVYNDRLKAAYDELQRVRHDRAMASPGAWKGLDDRRFTIEQDIGSFQTTVRANGGEPLPRPELPRKRSRTQTVRHDPAGGDGQRVTGKRKREPENPKPKAPKWTDREVEDGAGQPVATQVELDAHGVITDLRSEGRPPSALPGGKMGAHTTAWLVHKDVIRTALLGKTVPAAMALLPALGARAEEIGVRFGDIGSTGEPSVARAMGDLARLAGQTPRAHLPLLLQEGVNRILAYINKLPGVALDVVNTKGNQEGGHRAVLLRREGGERLGAEVLLTSLLGLLDVRSVVDRPKRLVFLRNHLVQVQRAYPLSYRDSRIAAMDVEREVLPLLRAKKTPGKKMRTEV